MRVVGCKLYVAALLKGEETITVFVSATDEEETKNLLKEKFNAQILKIKALGQVIRREELPMRYDLDALFELIRGEDNG